MRSLRRICLLIACLGLTACAQAGAASPDRMTAAQFADSISVNTHVNYTDGDYAQWPKVIEALKFLGVKEVRDQALDPKNQGQENYSHLANAGFRLSFITWRTDLPQLIADLAAFEIKHPGAVSAIEGVNEITNAPHFTYIGLKGKPAAQAYQRDLNALVKVNPALKHVPVYNFSDDSDDINAADYDNFHEYAHQGELPDKVLARGLARVKNARIPEKPVVCTEFGYFTAERSVGWGGVTNEQQAAFILRGLAINAAANIKRTYIYQLLDAYPDKDPAKPNQENYFGLFDRAYKPKPAAHAIRNTLRIFRAEESSVNAYKPKTPVTAGGVKTLVLPANGGAYFVLAWADESVDASIDFQTKATQVELFDPLKSDRARETYANVSTINLSIGTSPKILRVRVR